MEGEFVYIQEIEGGVGREEGRERRERKRRERRGGGGRSEDGADIQERRRSSRFSLLETVEGMYLDELMVFLSPWVGSIES